MTVTAVTSDPAAEGPQRPPWLLQVRREEAGPSCGSGFYVGNRLAVTCAHVAVEVTGSHVAPVAPGGGQVWVVFEYVGERIPVPAAIVGWFAKEDVAILELPADIPAGAAAPPLITLTGPEPVVGDAVTVLGYPEGHEDDAAPVAGHIDGVSGSGRISLVVDSPQGLEFESGFSGAPVWDHSAHGVVGMVGWREGPRREGIRETRKGYATSAEAIARLWPSLAPGMTDPLAFRRRRVLEEHTALPLADDGGPPLIGQIDIYDVAVGVVRSSYPAGADPYLPRQVDEALERGLAETGFVIASGPALSGKSRALIEMLRRTREGARLVVPRRRQKDADALSLIADVMKGQQDVVVWLDDLDEFFDDRVFDGSLLHRLVKRGWSVAATRTSAGKAREGGAGREFERLFRSLQRDKSIVEVSSLLTADELAKGAELYPREEFEPRGIGAQLAFAEILEHRFREGMDRRLPGWAVVQAAIDWRRMGMTKPVTELQLRTLSGLVLAETGSDTDDAFAAGLAWAVAPAEGRSQLLTEDVAAGYRVFSRLVEQAGDETSPTARPVPDASWSCMLNEDMALDGEDLVVLTVAAAGTDHDSVALDAVALARRLSPEGPVYHWATLFLGWLTDMAGDLDRACQLMYEAATAETREVASWGQLTAGLLEYQLGRSEEAERHLRAAASDEDPVLAALGKANLGDILLEQGLTAEAEELLESVLVDLDDAEAVSIASRSYVELYAGGDPSGSLDKSDKSHIVTAPRLLGIEEMREMLRVRGGMRARLLASLRLGGLQVSRGRDPGRAMSLLAGVLESDDPAIRLRAHFSMGQLLVSQGRRAEGKEHFQAILEAGDPELEAEALIELARIAYADGELAIAIRILREVRDGGNTHMAAAAAQVLGDLLCAEGRIEAGQESYRWAIDSGDPTWAGAATVRLAISLCRSSLPERWRGLAMLRELAAGSDQELAPRAALVLGDLLDELGDVPGARAAYELAIGSEHPYWVPMAKIGLAYLLGAGEHERAENLLAEAEAADDAEISLRAHVLHMALLVDLDGDVEEEIERHRQATHRLAQSPLLTFPVTFWYLVRSVESRDIDAAASHAVELRQILENMSGGAGSMAPAIPETGLSGVEPTEPAAIYLAVADQLYEAELWQESSAMLDVLSEYCAELLSPVWIAALAARQGRAQITLSDAETTEATLRDAVAQSSRLGPPAAASEAMARFHLASLLAITDRLDEGRHTALPLVTDAGLVHLGYEGRAKHLLAMIAIKSGRKQRDAELARREFGMAGGLLAEALQEARRAADDRLERQISDTIGDHLRDLEMPVVVGGSAGLSASAASRPAEVPLGPSLPPRLLCLLGTMAGAEGELDEAAYWLDRAEDSLSDPDPGIAENVRAVRQELSSARAALLWDGGA